MPLDKKQAIATAPEGMKEWVQAITSYIRFKKFEADDKEDKKLDKREQGIARAAKKLSKEGYQRDPEGGEAKERQRRRSQKGGDRTEKVRGERTPMPPRGDKRREDFERWYAANVR